MSSRLTQLFAAARQNDRKLLSAFITAGYPQLESTAELFALIEQAGVDFIEIGMPFSDPIADGPTIQQTSQTALRNGVSISTILAQIERIRKDSDLPIILMGYLNPVYRFGIQRFAERIISLEVDGLIIPDWPPHARIAKGDLSGDLPLNYLVAPNSSDKRIQEIDQRTADFLYCVSVTGITGSRQGLPPDLAQYLRRVKNIAKHPCMVGFGISTPAQAAEISQLSDGIIIGSAISKIISESPQSDRLVEKLSGFVMEIKMAMKGAENGD